MSRRWDAETYDRVSDPLVRMGGDVLERLDLAGDETVIDAGCGTGRVTTTPRGRKKTFRPTMIWATVSTSSGLTRR